MSSLCIQKVSVSCNPSSVSPQHHKEVHVNGLEGLGPSKAVGESSHCPTLGTRRRTGDRTDVKEEGSYSVSHATLNYARTTSPPRESLHMSLLPVSSLVCLFVSPASICLSVFLPFCLSVSPIFVCLSVQLSVTPVSLCCSLCQSVCLCHKIYVIYGHV